MVTRQSRNSEGLRLFPVNKCYSAFHCGNHDRVYGESDGRSQKRCRGRRYCPSRVGTGREWRWSRAGFRPAVPRAACGSRTPALEDDALASAMLQSGTLCSSARAPAAARTGPAPGGGLGSTRRPSTPAAPAGQIGRRGPFAATGNMLKKCVRSRAGRRPEPSPQAASPFEVGDLG